MEKPHLVLIYDERMPSGMVKEFCDDIDNSSLNLTKEELPINSSPQNSFEVFAISAISLLILKPYFEGFLKKAGKNHYDILRKSLKKLWRHLFSKDRKRRFVALTARGEVKQKYSLLFSILVEIDSGKKVKFLIREDCSEAEYAEAIDAFLNLMDSYHSSNSRNELDINLDEERDFWRQVLIEFDTESKSLHVLNPLPRVKNKAP